MGTLTYSYIYICILKILQGLALTKVLKIKTLIIIGGAPFQLASLAEKAYSPPIECPSVHFSGISVHSLFLVYNLTFAILYPAGLQFCTPFNQVGMNRYKVAEEVHLKLYCNSCKTFSCTLALNLAKMHNL